MQQLPKHVNPKQIAIIAKKHRKCLKTQTVNRNGPKMQKHEKLQKSQNIHVKNNTCQISQKLYNIMKK